jgi:HEAT repeats
MGKGLQQSTSEPLGRKILRLMNLRPGETRRTFLMFTFYAITSIGVLWFEASSTGLFLENYGAKNLPWIYLASMVISSFFGLMYSWLQRFVPLRWVIVLVAVLMALPLPLFQLGLEDSQMTAIFGLTVAKICVFGMSLWLRAIYVLSDLNASIASNQLFNIREIKRTYPLISSGVLLADVISGFALPLILNHLPEEQGLAIVVLSSFAMMLIGAGILFYTNETHKRYYPNTVWRNSPDANADSHASRIRGELSRYRGLLFVFFILAEALFLLVDFQFNSQLETPYLVQMLHPGVEVSQGKAIAGFIGLFQGILGFFELAMQWGFSSRMIDRIGVFRTVASLPLLVLIFGTVSIVTQFIPQLAGQLQLQFLIMIALKFLYELLHFTLFASVGPVMFQPIPDSSRSSIQAAVRGTAEPIATGIIGIALVVGLSFYHLDQHLGKNWQSVIMAVMVVLALAWLVTTWLARNNYLKLLVLGAGRGDFRGTDAELKELGRSVVEALNQPGIKPEDQRSCVELLSQIDRKNVGTILAPMLDKFPPQLQQKVLEVMLSDPKPEYLPQVRKLITASTPAPVAAVALRYLFVADHEPDLKRLTPFLRTTTQPVVRGTAAALLLELGNPRQKAEATNSLRQMLTHKDDNERLMGCRALGNLRYLQALQLYVPALLKDPAVAVRCEVLEAIANTRLEKFYPELVQGLHSSDTRSAAVQAIVSLDNEALPLLDGIVQNRRLSDVVRRAAWSILGQIATPDALDLLSAQLSPIWGEDRQNILRSLVKVPTDRGIESALEKLGRGGIETLIDQEMMLIGQSCAGQLDLRISRTAGEEAQMLRRALVNVQTDGIDRIFLLMQFLYEPRVIQAAAFNLQSGSSFNMAQGLEILDNQLDIPHKRALLTLLDRNVDLEKSEKQLQAEIAAAGKAHDMGLEKHLRSQLEKIARQQQAELEKQIKSLSALLTYEPLAPEERLSQLMDLRHFMPDWVVACCFHLARKSAWDLARPQVLNGLRHAKGYVREASLLYLQDMYPDTLPNVLPKLRNDADRLVRRQVELMLQRTNLRLLTAPDDDEGMTTTTFGPMGSRA